VLGRKVGGKVADRADRTDIQYAAQPRPTRLRRMEKASYGCRVRACPCLRLPERERERERERLPPVAAASFPSLSANANSTGRFRGQRRLRTVGPDAAHHSVLGADKWARHGVSRVSIATLPGAVALFGSPGGVHTSAALCSTPIKLCYQGLRTGQSN
jgi:hypothetical protein